LPAWISPSRAPTAGGPPPPLAVRIGGPRGAELFGIGGGGGAKDAGIGGGGGGGGGGGALGTPESGIGGGGGGALGAPESGIGGGGGGARELGSKVVGADRLSSTGVDGLLSIADNGRGGAMVPKRMDARCLADPPVGPSSPSSLESSLSDSAADHSSSSGRLRDWGPVLVCVSGFAASCCAMRWNGLVDDSSFGADGGGESAWA
jgi:hypothetical protein